MSKKEIMNFEQTLQLYIQTQTTQSLMEKFNLSHPAVINLKKRGDVKIPISCIPSLLKEINYA